MIDCDGGPFCLMCHTSRALAVYVAALLAYVGFLWAVLRWMP